MSRLHLWGNGGGETEKTPAQPKPRRGNSSQDQDQNRNQSPDITGDLSNVDRHMDSHFFLRLTSHFLALKAASARSP